MHIKLLLEHVYKLAVKHAYKDISKVYIRINLSIKHAYKVIFKAGIQSYYFA